VKHHLSIPVCWELQLYTEAAAAALVTAQAAAAAAAESALPCRQQAPVLIPAADRKCWLLWD